MDGYGTAVGNGLPKYAGSIGAALMREQALSGGLSTASEIKTTERSRQIPRALEEQEKLLAMLGQSVDMLRARLQPVVVECLNPIPPNDRDEPAKEQFCGIASRLNNHNCNLARMVNALSSLAPLIEL